MENSFNHSSGGNAITSYITNVSTMNESTAHQYLSRLKDLESYGIPPGCRLKHGNQDPFDLLNSYAAYLKNHNISPLTLYQRIITAKNFFEYCDIERSPLKFKLKVKLPKTVRKKKEALSKEDIIEILNVCDNIRLRTYAILLAATGMRTTVLKI